MLNGDPRCQRFTINGRNAVMHVNGCACPTTRGVTVLGDVPDMTFTATERHFFTGGEVPAGSLVRLPDGCSRLPLELAPARRAYKPLRAPVGGDVYFSHFDALSAVDAARLAKALA